MASHHLPLFLLLLILLPSTFAATYFFSVFKSIDQYRPQYHTKFEIGTPPVPVTLTLDIANAYPWILCDIIGYNRSSTYTVVHCYTPDCDALCSATPLCFDSCSDTPSPTPSCNNNDCGSLASNPFTGYVSGGYVIRDTTTILSRKTPSSTAALTAVPRFPTSCVSQRLQVGLSKYSNGILSLAKAPFSAQAHVISTFKLSKKFAVCLPSSYSAHGVTSGAVYFGGGPYIFPPSKVDLSTSMVKTPLVVNNYSSVEPYDIYDPTVKYYIKLKSIEIDGTPVKFNSSLLSFDGDGNGGTVMSTIAPYTNLQTEIYTSFIDLFVAKAKAKNVKTVVSPRKEYGACFDPNSIKYDPRTGSGLPVVDFVLDGGGRWRIFGSNSVMAVVGSNASCLAFVEAKKPVATPTPVTYPAVMIGGVQMEDTLVEFDLEASKVGVTSSLLKLGTSCAQFKRL